MSAKMTELAGLQVLAAAAVLAFGCLCIWRRWHPSRPPTELEPTIQSKPRMASSDSPALVSDCKFSVVTAVGSTM